MHPFICAGDVAQMREDAERQFVQAAQEQSKVKEKLFQVERNALLTLNNREQIHREQLEAERQQKVQYDFVGFIGSHKMKSDTSVVY